jgi:hypothetical protein
MSHSNTTRSLAIAAAVLFLTAAAMAASFESSMMAANPGPSAKAGPSGVVLSIQLEHGAFEVKGWTPPASEPAQGWSSIFSIYTGAPGTPALLGTYAVEAGILVFRPQFPFAPGVHYRAVFRIPGGARAMEKTFTGPGRATIPAARVESVYPSADILPSNQLRLYLYFSAPMSREEAGTRVHLLDESGRPLQDVFLPGEELWDPAYRRLTLTFDPGRIKRGLTSNRKMGPPLSPGRRYTLVVDRGWPDARGVPMVKEFRKVFRGGPPQRTPPDPGQWHITSPRSGSRDALVVGFPRSMNYPLLLRMLHVAAGNGTIAGSVRIAQHETEWRFTPEEPWKPGAYQLSVNTALEDLAGNHIGQAFDLDVFDHVSESIANKSISLDIQIR